MSLSTVDLIELDLLPALPAAYLSGEDRDLLTPLRFLPPGDMPEGASPALSQEESPAGSHRPDLARALETANDSYGHPRATELAELLADPATRVVVAGQQPGLFGGPLYTLSKAVAATRWAEELRQRGEPAVAVFWVATEDHDWDEVARTTLLLRGELRTFDLGEDPQPLLPVGMRSLGEGVAEILGELREATHGDRYAAWLDTLGRHYRPDARFGEAFCRLLVELLGEDCPLLLDSMLAEVKVLQKPWLRRLVTEHGAVEEALAEADREIGERGHDHQVPPQRGVSPLFLLHQGERRRIEWRGDGGETGDGPWGLRGREDVGGSLDELLERVEDNPAAVSPGVLARPAIQDALLGTHLQVMGPGELAYLAQAAPVYRVLGLTAPWVCLRPQAVVLESHRLEQLEETGLTLRDLFLSTEQLEALLAAGAGENPVGRAEEHIREALENLREPVLEVDASLERPWEKTRDQVLRGLDALRGKVTGALARRDEVRTRRVERLRQACLPNGELQERVVSTAHFPGKYGDRFAAEFHCQLGLDPRRLQVIAV